MHAVLLPPHPKCPGATSPQQSSIRHIMPGEQLICSHLKTSSLSNTRNPIISPVLFFFFSFFFLLFFP